MALKDEIKSLDDELFSGQAESWREHNAILLDIHEGNLIGYVLKDLRDQLTDKAYESAKHRVAPINVLPKIISKLSQVFDKEPVRQALGIDGKESNGKEKDLLEWYKTELDINTNSVQANEYLNLHKVFAYEPFIDQRKPRLRVIPGDRFYPFSRDPANPLRMTHFAKIMGSTTKANGESTVLYVMYTDREIRAYYKGGEEAYDFMRAKGMDGINPYGKIPFVYCARSKVSLVPKADTDTLQMTKLLPILMTDLNYAVMYLSFGITWTKDCSVTGVRAPNAIWQLKTDPESKGDAAIGTIKPEVDVEQVLSLIKTILTMWMDSRNIKSGSMGDISVQNAASGIAKAIDEMDTSADRKKQVPFLKNADEELFELVINHMHPVWVSRVQGFEKPVLASKGTMVATLIGEQRPVSDRSKDIEDQERMMKMGIQSKRGALAELNPDWDEAQIEEKLKEIEDERSGEQPETASGGESDAEAESADEAPLDAKEEAQEAQAAG